MSTNVLRDLDSRPFDEPPAVEALRAGEACSLAGLTAVKSAGWLTLSSPAELLDATGVRDDTGRNDIGRPGLWKTRADIGRLTQRRVFELPVDVLDQAVHLHDDGAADAVQQLRTWAVATEGGDLRCDWSPPPREDVESWFARERLTFQSAAVLRQGTLSHEPKRLALGFPIVAAPANDLSAARREWLHALAADAQDQLRMVRVGTTTDGALHAEIDLTGAPHSFLEPLLRTGLDALRWVVGWIARTAELLVDASLQYRALDLCSPRA